MSNQYCFNVGPVSQTVGQHLIKIGSTYLIYFSGHVYIVNQYVSLATLVTVCYFYSLLNVLYVLEFSELLQKLFLNATKFMLFPRVDRLLERNMVGGFKEYLYISAHIPILKKMSSMFK